MNFQIEALPADRFEALFALSDEALHAQQGRRQTVTKADGIPCRVSLADAEVGEEVILVNYEHQPGDSPYRSRHAIYVRGGAQQAHLQVNEVPEMIRSRLISARFFDAAHMIVVADVVEGAELATHLADRLEDPRIAYAHLHFAKPGCFAASAHPIGR